MNKKVLILIMLFCVTIVFCGCNTQNKTIQLLQDKGYMIETYPGEAILIYPPNCDGYYKYFCVSGDLIENYVDMYFCSSEKVVNYVYYDEYNYVKKDNDKTIIILDNIVLVGDINDVYTIKNIIE